MQPSTTANLVQNDPLMQELWAIKAQINAEANYSVEEIVRRMRIKYPQVVVDSTSGTSRQPSAHPTHSQSN